MFHEFQRICKAICTVIQAKYHQFPKMFNLWEEYCLNCCNFVSNLSFSWKFLVSDRQYNHSEPCKAHCRHPLTENVIVGQDARVFFCLTNLSERLRVHQLQIRSHMYVWNNENHAFCVFERSAKGLLLLFFRFVFSRFPSEGPLCCPFGTTISNVSALVRFCYFVCVAVFYVFFARFSVCFFETLSRLQGKPHFQDFRQTRKT